MQYEIKSYVALAQAWNNANSEKSWGGQATTSTSPAKGYF